MFFKNSKEALLHIAGLPGIDEELLGDLLRVIAKQEFVEVSFKVDDQEAEYVQTMSQLQMALYTLCSIYLSQLEDAEGSESTGDLRCLDDESFELLAPPQQRIHKRFIIVSAWFETALNEVALNQPKKFNQGDLAIVSYPFKVLRVPKGTKLYWELISMEEEGGYSLSLNQKEVSC